MAYDFNTFSYEFYADLGFRLPRDLWIGITIITHQVYLNGLPCCAMYDVQLAMDVYNK